MNLKRITLDDTVEETVNKINENSTDIEENVSRLEAEFIPYKDNITLKTSKIEKELNDYKATMQKVNINQEPKQKATGYGVISLPPNAANGQVSVSVKGNTYTQIAEIDQSDWRNSFTAYGDSEITQNSAIIRGDYAHRIELNNPIEYQEGKKYGMLIKAYPDNTYIWYRGINKGFRVSEGYVKTIFDYNDLDPILAERQRFWSGSADATTWITKLIIVELDAQSEWDFTNLSPEELSQKYHCIFGTKSTVGAMRVKSVGKNVLNYKNVFPKKLDGYDFGATPHAIDNGVKFVASEPFTGIMFPVTLKPNTKYSLSFQRNDSIRVMIKPRSGTTALETLFTSTSNNVFFTTTKYNDYWIMLDSSTTSGERIVTDIQLERGDTATEYEPYIESNAYIIAKDPEAGEILELRSLPNGTKDEVSGGQKIQRIKEHVLQASDIIYATDYVNTSGVYIAKPLDYIGRGVEGYINGNATISGMNEGRIEDDISSIGNFNSTSPNAFLLRFAKGTYPTTAAAQAALTGTKLTYQLAEPVEIPVQVSGTLLSYPSGTVYVEPVVADAGVYTDKIEVLHQDLPIKAIEQLSKVDFMTGVETELDINQAEISEDKLSFTHPELNAGDIVFFEYEYDVESTEGEAEVEFYDSRYVIKDSVTDKFYKWNVTVADGVPSIELVEV